MSPNQIAEVAIREGHVETSGATPSQTFKAKLATDVQKRRQGSRFMRTAKNRFALREWSQHTEYVADRFQKALLDEEIVVFPRELLGSFVPGPGLHNLSPDQAQDLLVALTPMQRREAEDDFGVIQLVSAFVVRIGNRIATYKRTRRLPESRLHRYHSLLFGGHLNPEDVPPLFSIFDPDYGSLYIQRELEEELRFSDQPSMSFVGLIYDDRREVSLQHIGVLYDVKPSPTTKIEVGERGFLQDLRFETASEITARIGDFENWSELVLTRYLQTNGK